MPKSEVVAMFMQQSFKDIQFLFPKEFHQEGFSDLRSCFTFDENVVGFLNALSQELNNDKNIRAFPDVATFAFFCRKANILNLSKRFNQKGLLRLGRGTIFHVAPSNVPVNFAYSLVAGLLAGNVNIVRVPSKDFDQITMICNAIDRIGKSGKFPEVLEKIILIRYHRQSQATSYFSSISDVRIIWGGDETIAQIRKSPLPARAYDVTFADRYSFCVINADEYINEASPEKTAKGFYNDTYLFDQNACSAPHLIIWLGAKENIVRSKSIFWNALQKVVDQNYQIQAVMAVDKLTSFYEQTIQDEQVHKVDTRDNSLWRVNWDSLPHNVDGFRCAGGYFSEFEAESLDDIAHIINRKYQTLAVYGVSEQSLNDFISKQKPSGIDRIVPIGRTTDFSLLWDGYDLISTLSRTVEIV